MRYPERVICLTEETVETLYRIGESDRIVGISGFVVRPKEARKKPIVSTFLDAKIDKILELKPHLVLAFSDLQADIAAALGKAGVAVHLFNQRSIEEILVSIRVTCALVGRAKDGELLADQLERDLDALSAQASKFSTHPRVFFEEWNEPLISGIAWCSELIERLGGIDICAESRVSRDAKGRIFDPAEVVRRDPEIVIASWCGKKAQRVAIVERFGPTSAVKEDQLYEIKSSLILQPGPAALTDGAAQMFDIFEAFSKGERLPAIREGDLRASKRLPTI